MRFWTTLFLPHPELRAPEECSRRLSVACDGSASIEHLLHLRGDVISDLCLGQSVDETCGVAALLTQKSLLVIVSLCSCLSYKLDGRAVTRVGSDAF